MSAELDSILAEIPGPGEQSQDQPQDFGELGSVLSELPDLPKEDNRTRVKGDPATNRRAVADSFIIDTTPESAMNNDGLIASHERGDRVFSDSRKLAHVGFENFMASLPAEDREAMANGLDFVGDLPPNTIGPARGVSTLGKNDVLLPDRMRELGMTKQYFSTLPELAGLAYKQSAAGLALAAGEATGQDISFGTRSRRIIDEMMKPTNLAPIALIEELGKWGRDAIAQGFGADEKLTDYGKASRAEALARLQEITPAQQTFLQHVITSNVQSAALMFPGLLVSMLTKNPDALLISFGLSTYGQSYGDARDQGLSPEDAHRFALRDAGVEVGTEIFPSKFLVGAGKGDMTKFLFKFLSSEMAGEETATILQKANALASGVETMPIDQWLGELWYEMKVTAVATATLGPVQAGTARMIDRVGNLVKGKQQEEAPAEQGPAVQEPSSTDETVPPEAIKQEVERVTGGQPGRAKDVVESIVSDQLQNQFKVTDEDAQKLAEGSTITDDQLDQIINNEGQEGAFFDSVANERRALDEQGNRIDRRQDLDQRKLVDEMTPEELRAALLTNELTGLKNRRAFQEAEQQAPKVKALIDVDSLKYINDNFGHEAGDELLKITGEALEQTTNEAYHISGDEFVVRGDTVEEIKANLDRANKFLSEKTISYETPDGKRYEYKGPGFSFGISESSKEADARLNEHKLARESSGERAARGERPPGLAEVTATGGETEDRVARDPVLDAKTLITAEDGRAYILEDLAQSVFKAGQSLAQFTKALAAKLGNAVKSIADHIKRLYNALNAHLDQVTLGKDVGAVAFHGSPHKFGKFSTEKIGTGEGAQAFGYGLYFAGQKEVAEWYKKMLTRVKHPHEARTEAVEKFVNDNDLHSVIDIDRLSSGGRVFKNDLVRALSEARYGSYWKEGDDIWTGEPSGAYDLEDAEKTYPGEVRKKKIEYDRLKKIIQSGITTIEFDIPEQSEGALYQVELAPEEDEYLLWDKTLSEQSEKVKYALRREFDRAENENDDISKVLRLSWDSVDSGRDLYRDLDNWFSRKTPDSKKAASDYLHSIGIRGIKYLEGMSRSKGEGNYNYVIFSDEDVSITQILSGKTRILGEDGRAYILEDLAKAVFEAGQSLAEFTKALSVKLGNAVKKIAAHIKLLYDALNAHLEKVTTGAQVGAIGDKPKGRIIDTTGQARRRDENTLTEYEALKASFQKAAQAARIALRNGDQEGVAREKNRMRAILEKGKARQQAQSQVRKLKAQINRELKKSKVKKDKAGKPVGRYGAEAQRILDKLRPLTKLTKPEARARLLSNIEQIDRGQIVSADIAIENRLLSIVAAENEGLDQTAFANLQLPALQKMVADLQSLKTTGRLARDARSEARTANISQIKADILKSITTVPVSAATGEEAAKRKLGLKQRIRNFTIANKAFNFVQGWDDLLDILSFNEKGTSPIPGQKQSLISQFGNVLEQQNHEKSLNMQHMETLQDMVKDVYGLKNERQMLKKFRQDSQIVNLGEFITNNEERVRLEMSRAEARKRAMEMLDPTLRDTIFSDRGAQGMGWTKEMGDAVWEFLTPQDEEFIRRQLQFYQEFYNQINDVYSEIYGVDLPKNPFYSPIAREGISEDATSTLGEFFQEMKMRSSPTSGGLISRVGSRAPLVARPDISVLQQHVAEMSHFIAWANKIRDMNAVFLNGDVRSAVRVNFGKSLDSTIEHFIHDMARGGIDTRKKIATLDRMLGLYARSVLALKPAIAAKQLTSFIAYADAIPLAQYARYLGGSFNLPKITKFFMENSVLVKNRWQSGEIERDIKSAIRTAEYARWKKNPSFINSLMLNVKIGDIGAIIFGGYPVYKYNYDRLVKSGLEPAEAKKKAIAIFEQVTKTTQQSPDLSEQSGWQRSGSFAKAFTSFASSPNQYFRKELGAVRNLAAGRISPAQFAKTVAIYHFILPMLFQWVSDGFEWDSEEQKRAMILGALNGWFIVGDALDFIIRKSLGLQTFEDVGRPPFFSAFSDLVKGIGDIFNIMDEDKIYPEDVALAVRHLSGAAGAVTGAPLKTVVDEAQGISDILAGDYEKGILEAMGWSPFVAGKVEQ